MVKISCTGENYQDCGECGKYFSGHSLHYCPMNRQKVSEISCSIGGNRTFDEDGHWIDNSDE